MMKTGLDVILETFYRVIHLYDKTDYAITNSHTIWLFTFKIKLPFS